MTRFAAPVLALAVLAALWPHASFAAPTPAQTSPAPIGRGVTYVVETSHNLVGAFKRFYDANGGVAIFGHPISEPLMEDGLRVQYFERARFEQHAGGQLALTRVGAELAYGRSEPAFQWIPADPGGDRRYVAASGHTLGGAFAAFWDEHGSVTIFGHPISEEFFEPGPDGAPRLVQYFERARFELPAAPDGQPQIVQLGLVGRELLARRPAAHAAAAPATPLALLGQATTSFRASSFERRTNIERSVAMVDGSLVMPGEEHSFLGVGNFSPANGFVEGYGIVSGRLERVIGGGLCQTSSTLFRAVSNAGLEVTKRVGHTYIVSFYEDVLGFDATVFNPQLDFRWRNDTTAPVLVVGLVDAAAGKVTFELWGQQDGRQVSYVGPVIRNVVRQGTPVWQYDSTLAAGQTRQLVSGRPGMHVTYTRTVVFPDGRAPRQDRYVTHYRPWDDYVLYGSGVRPPTGSRIMRAATTP
jgi:hypothetical protein